MTTLDHSTLKEYQTEIFGSKMIIDIEEVINFCKVDDSEEVTINAAKYEIVRGLLDVIMASEEEFDNKMGFKSIDNSSFEFKLALNTLIEYKILKETN